MGIEIPSPSLFLVLLLLVFQGMMLMTPSEAVMCETHSSVFTGLCFSDRNCGSICEKEGFSSGHCRALKCICAKDCNVGETPPGQGPPDQGPPDQGPPGPGGDYPPQLD